MCFDCLPCDFSDGPPGAPCLNFSLAARPPDQAIGLSALRLFDNKYSARVLYLHSSSEMFQSTTISFELQTMSVAFRLSCN